MFKSFSMEHMQEKTLINSSLKSLRLQNMRFYRRRTNFKNKLPGKLFDVETQKYFNTQPIDISPFGIGLLSMKRLINKQIVWIVLENRYLKFLVVYCQINNKQTSTYRVGLQLIDKNIDLISLFRTSVHK